MESLTITVDFFDEIAVRIRQHNFDAPLGKFYENISQFNLFGCLEIIPAVSGEVTCGTDRIIRRVKINKVFAAVSKIQNFIEFSNFNLNGGE